MGLGWRFSALCCAQMPYLIPKALKPRLRGGAGHNATRAHMPTRVRVYFSPSFISFRGGWGSLPLQRAGLRRRHATASWTWGLLRLMEYLFSSSSSFIRPPPTITAALSRSQWNSTSLSNPTCESTCKSLPLSPAPPLPLSCSFSIHKSPSMIICPLPQCQHQRPAKLCKCRTQCR